MRPEFHFTAASGWINDPHGITYRDGEYHAFFQQFPAARIGRRTVTGGMPRAPTCLLQGCRWRSRRVR